MAQVDFQYTRYYSKSINRTVEIPDDVPKHKQISYILENHKDLIEEVCDASLCGSGDDEIEITNDFNDEDIKIWDEEDGE